ncbi:hypothetical protein CQW29_00940 [Pantoea coffeiphila]|uniref:Chaperone protein Skp n=1 Tax=Pantoea coffeiphila TaxID=1465635 RepID=A0A2S9IHH4_9GAMM|nr:hypothetical protein CQW29_00940 [Pantoea coffeiphila]
MKILCAVLSVLLIVAVGYIFHQHQAVPERIALLDVEKIIAQSAPGKAGREHLSIIDRRFQKGMDDLHRSYQNAPEEEQQRVFSNAEETLVRQFSVEERGVSDALKKIIYEEAEKWRKEHNIGAIFPAQLALVSSDKQLDCTDEILAAVDRRQITFAELPVLQINQPPAMTPVSPLAKKKAEAKPSAPEVTKPQDSDSQDQGRPAPTAPETKSQTGKLTAPVTTNPESQTAGLAFSGASAAN